MAQHPDIQAWLDLAPDFHKIMQEQVDRWWDGYPDSPFGDLADMLSSCQSVRHSLWERLKEDEERPELPNFGALDVEDISGCSYQISMSNHSNDIVIQEGAKLHTGNLSEPLELKLLGKGMCLMSSLQQSRWMRAKRHEMLNGYPPNVYCDSYQTELDMGRIRGESVSVYLPVLAPLGNKLTPISVPQWEVPDHAINIASFTRDANYIAQKLSRAGTRSPHWYNAYRIVNKHYTNYCVAFDLEQKVLVSGKLHDRIIGKAAYLKLQPKGSK